ncbi:MULTISPECIES: hypothetical protein [unclassified Pseudoalteromonas]|uniref:hypothetical protein n=1 Tax=unclassified Pseudoalteromonas TaxID=194690 RepID=UPI001F1A5BB8|nr:MULTISPECIES: hypothetical protein [unclassified Pseudoalteromonas]MCF2829711.1 hypothetical protein [Pseudoalteromonas sp. OF5H-5]MCF2832605.1 hypothetical protein [Pseudoalteromonas sp. DL2-H6]MCF2927601.1 hypothetical protein [Pseudoalteromonas sp. DL2-H1]
MNRILISVFTLSLSIPTLAKKPDSNPYGFDWKSSADMSGAFMMCGLTGFVIEDCPKVLLKCMTDPDLLKFKLFGVRSKCLDLFAFLTSATDVKEAIDYANEQSGSLLDEEAKRSLYDGSRVVEDYEQTNDQEVTRELYKNTKYYKADLAAENLINDDYAKYYYQGENGRGGYGSSYYQRNYFDNNVYSGETPSEAYDRAYEDYMVKSGAYNCRGLVDDIPPNCLIDHRKKAREAGSRAYSEADDLRDDAYSDWRRWQGWDNYGYGRTELEGNYNTDRLTAYYHAYLSALDGICRNNEACAKREAQKSIDSMRLMD